MMKIYLGFLVSFFILLSLTCCKKPVLPVITTIEASEITINSAVIGCEILDDGGSPISEKGICWSLADYPDIYNKRTSETTYGSFSSMLTQLIPNTLYYARAYATNSIGTGYGKSVNFRTLGGRPVTNALAVTNLNLTSATLNGTVNPKFLQTTVTFEFGKTTGYGKSFEVTGYSNLSDSDVPVSLNISDLKPGTLFHYRIKAENPLGISYSNNIAFYTSGAFVDSLKTSNLQMNSAVLTGQVNPRNIITYVEFEWGSTTSYGNTVEFTQSPLSGNNNIIVSIPLYGLQTGTSYHFRIKATNTEGTTLSDDFVFETLKPVTDIEGNSYNVMTFGKNVWMVENLKTARYSDGTSINYGLYYPENKISNVPVYGYLYDWTAAIKQSPKYDTVMMDLSGQIVQGVCPVGWHLPKIEDWLDLINTYGGLGSAGLKLKKADPHLWIEPFLYELPVSGFDALPAGLKYLEGGFHVCGQIAYYWTSSQYYTGGGTIMGKPVYIQNDRPDVLIILPFANNVPGSIGLSVRCVKNKN